MAPTPLDGRTRDRLLALLADDRPDPALLLTRLRELGIQADFAAFSAALGLLAHLHLSEADAEELFRGLLAHRAEMGRLMRRDPGLRVAAMDFLPSVEPRLARAVVIESSLLTEQDGQTPADPLTGLLARSFFRAAIEREVRRGRRHRRPCSLVLLALDRFEHSRDSNGQLFGDALLEHAAGIFRRSLRETDVGGRLDGTRFGALLPETSREGAARVAERIRARVESDLRGPLFRGRPVGLTIAAGIGCCPQEAHTSDTLVARASAALDLARRAGGNRVIDHVRERRECPRRVAEPSMVVSFEGASDDPPRRAVAVNVSRTGVLLTTEVPYCAGDPIRIRLRSARAGFADEQLIAGRVVRIEPDGGGAARTGIGVRFDASISDELLPIAEGGR